MMSSWQRRRTAPHSGGSVPWSESGLLAATGSARRASRTRGTEFASSPPRSGPSAGLRAQPSGMSDMEVEATAADSAGEAEHQGLLGVAVTSDESDGRFSAVTASFLERLMISADLGLRGTTEGSDGRTDIEHEGLRVVAVRSDEVLGRCSSPAVRVAAVRSDEVLGRRSTASFSESLIMISTGTDLGGWHATENSAGDMDVEHEGLLGGVDESDHRRPPADSVGAVEESDHRRPASAPEVLTGSNDWRVCAPVPAKRLGNCWSMCCARGAARLQSGREALSCVQALSLPS